jgi:hypothetical protein
MTNYKLKDNLSSSLTLLEKGKRNEAKTAGRTIIEDLSLVSEYFEDEIDDMSGRKRPPAGAFTFAQQVYQE